MPLPADLYHTLDRALPVALLPVRLETRWGTRPATTSAGADVALPVLRVRIYPDDISVDDHQPGLTDAEVAAGRAYWSAVADPPADQVEAERRRFDAWERLGRQVGVLRAPYVAEATAGGAEPPRRVASRAATAEMFPERWAVIGWCQGKRAFAETSGPVRVPLAVGPAPRTDGQPILDPETVRPTDEALRWIADYDEAVAAGMAVTVDLVSPDDFAAGVRPPVLTSGLERLFVFGVREPGEGRTPEDEANALMALFEHHRTARGAGFLRQGTPTNNARERRSGWTARPDSSTGAGGPTPAAEVARPLRGNGANAVVAATALGLPPDALAAFEHGEVAEGRQARLMNEALFPVTWGELIGQLLIPTEVDATHDEGIIRGLERARTVARMHFLNFVRGRGPLPAIRVRRQPYGILPVTDPARWARQAGEPEYLPDLVGLLRRLRPFWEYAAGQTPRLPRDVPDADEASRRLVQVLGLGPVPHPASYAERTATGELTSKLYSSRPDLPVESFSHSTLDAAAVSLVAGVAQRNVYRHLLANVAHLSKKVRLLAMELQEPQLLVVPVARTQGEHGPASYLAELGAATWDQLRQATPWGGDPPPDLLYQLAIRALRLANEQSALALIREMSGWDRLHGQLLGSPLELSQFQVERGTSLGATIAEPVRQFAEQAMIEAVPADLRDRSLGEIVSRRPYIDQFRLPDAPEAPPATGEFLDTQRALAELGAAGLSDADYERLVGETLATCSTRLDAWFTSIATQRLDYLRGTRAAGLQVGAYGWLLDLPAPLAQPTVDAGLLEGWEEGSPLVSPRRQVGYVHAPSLAQAETAAVLRAAELSHGDQGSTVARLDLTSARMRVATGILDAVQQGQPLGAVLGYRLERLLHERSREGANLHAIVDDLRAAFPQRGAPPPGAAEGEARDQVVPREVLDGVDAWNAWRAGRLPSLALNAAEHAALAEVMHALDGAVEAVADLLVAEGVHQMVAGNAPRAATTLNAAAYGEAPPAEFDVLRSPRNGTVITNRVVLAFSPRPAADTPAWAPGAPRARLAPALEAWLAGLLGDPARWTCDVVSEHERRSLSLADVDGLCALDVAQEATAGAMDDPGGQAGSPPDGAQSVLAARLAAAAGLPGGRVLQPASLADGRLGWDQLVAVAGVLRDVLAGARPLTVRDLQPPDAAGASQPPPAEVPSAGWDSTIPEGDEDVVPAAELTAIRDTLAGLCQEAQTALDALDRALAAEPVQPAAVRDALGTLVGFGLPGAAFALAAGDDDLPARAGAVAPTAKRALADTERALAEADAAPGARRLSALLAGARSLLGPTMPLAPRLSALPDLAPRPAFHPDDGDDPLADWLARTARVRPALTSLEDLRLFARALDLPAPALAVAQAPIAEGDAWLGGRLAPNAGSGNALRPWRHPTRPTVHLLFAAGAGVQPGDALAGLVVDEFAEVLPATTQTTGLALHYDAPNARPPQAVLLAVHPDPARASLPWSWELIENILAETLALARLRPVELEQLTPTAIDQFLPATYARDGLENVPPLHRTAWKYFEQVGLTTEFIAANRDWLVGHE